jgi:hypothetical protein
MRFIDSLRERIRRSTLVCATIRATTVTFSLAVATALVVDASLASGCSRDSSSGSRTPRPIADGGPDDDLIAMPGTKCSIQLVRRGSLPLSHPARGQRAVMTRDEELDAGRP